jgi:hypothetical protein
MLRGLGKMLAFEGLVAGALFAFGRFAPDAKAELVGAAKERLREASPELAEQLEQAEQLEREGIAQLSRDAAP